MVMVVIMGGMAGGAFAWGQVATLLSVSDALQIAAAGLIFGVLATWRVRLPCLHGIDLTPSMHWPAHTVDKEPEFHRGPVLVTLSYRVSPVHVEQFLRLMERQRIVRRRSGAFFWRVFQDISASDCYLETFMVESWLEHLRQHERVTKADQALQEMIHECLAEDSQPVVTHYLAAKRTSD